MSNSYTVVTRQSWFSRIGSALTGIVFGLLLFGGSFVLLAWNEYRSIRAITGLAEALKSVVSTGAETIVADNDGKLVHVSGRAVTDETLHDPLFGMSAQALRLVRRVEMYQYQESSRSETRNKVGGGTETRTVYSYSPTWADHPIDSRQFHEGGGSRYANPPASAWPFRGQTFAARGVHVGVFEVPGRLLDQYSVSEPLEVTEADVVRLRGRAPLPEETAPDSPADEPAPAPGIPLRGNEGNDTIAEPADTWQKQLRLADGGLFVGHDSAHPQVGDLRVRFSIAPQGPVSIVARQTGNSFSTWTSSNGYGVELLRAGNLSGEEVIRGKQAQENMLTWILRLVGFLMMTFGMALILRPLAVLADVIPFFGRVVGTGTLIISGVVALALSLTTIAVAWLAVRPLWAGGLIALAIAVLFLLRWAGKREPAAVAAPPPPPPVGGV